MVRKTLTLAELLSRPCKVGMHREPTLGRCIKNIPRYVKRSKSPDFYLRPARYVKYSNVKTTPLRCNAINWFQTHKLPPCPLSQRRVGKVCLKRPVKKRTVGRPVKKRTVGRPVKKRTVGRPVKKRTVGRPVKKRTVGRPVKKITVGIPVKKRTV